MVQLIIAVYWPQIYHIPPPYLKNLQKVSLDSRHEMNAPSVTGRPIWSQMILKVRARSRNKPFLIIPSGITLVFFHGHIDAEKVIGVTHIPLTVLLVLFIHLNIPFATGPCLQYSGLLFIKQLILIFQGRIRGKSKSSCNEIADSSITKKCTNRGSLKNCLLYFFWHLNY